MGAKLKLVAGDFVSFDQAKGGMSYCSAQDPRIYFGLGSRAKIDSLEITWPSGTVDVIRNPPPDQIITRRRRPWAYGLPLPKIPQAAVTFSPTFR